MTATARDWIVSLIAGVGGLLLLPVAFDPVHPLGGGPLWIRLLLVAIGWSFVVGAIGAWRMRPEKRTGNLLLACAASWWLALLIGTRVPIVWTLSSALQVLILPLLYYLVLAFPQGRLTTRWSRILVGMQVVFISQSIAFATVYDPAAFGCTNCQPGLNLLLIRSDPELILARDEALRWFIFIDLVFIATLIVRLIRSSPPRRRVLLPLYLPAIGWTLSFFIYGVTQLIARVLIYEPPTLAYHLSLLGFAISLLVLPLLFLVGLARLRGRRARISDLVLELGDLPTPERLRDALRKTLGDPSLQVGIWVPEAKRYLGADGRTLIEPAADDNRVATLLERNAEPLAMIVHDEALLEDPGLVSAVTAATKLAVENDRLQQELLDQLVEVHESRARIVQAADAERKRIERNLHDGAQQRLVALSVALRTVDSRLDPQSGAASESLEELSRELDQALEELRELARGTYPAILSEQGLPGAFRSLANTSRLPVDVDVDLNERLPERVEATGYFIASEALANAAKHAQASVVQLRARKDDGDLVVEVADDGVGGARMASGSGLRGLVDRVDALDGHITITSPAGQGTTVAARIPCE
ncbi:MAG TPA: histidine kinase [Actinomycetota bacterium]|nr:histidine kinase [Actinomycetota bacterium]